MASAIADIPCYRFTDEGLVGDHHADKDHPHSIRITARRAMAGNFAVIAIQDGEVIAELHMDELLSDAVGYPLGWAHPGRTISTIMGSIAAALRDGFRGDAKSTAVEKAMRWGRCIAATACVAGRTEPSGLLVAAMPTPFTETEIDAAFFSRMSDADRGAAYEAIAALREAAPKAMMTTWSEDAPTKLSINRMRIAANTPEGVLERMRTIIEATEFTQPNPQ